MSSSSKKEFKCSECNITFTRAYTRNRHIHNVHSKEKTIYKCSICRSEFDNYDLFLSHIKSHAPEKNY